MGVEETAIAELLTLTVFQKLKAIALVVELMTPIQDLQTQLRQLQQQVEPQWGFS